MNTFSKQRYFNYFQRNKCIFWAALTLIASATSTFAQSSSDLFRGTWQIDTPDEGALILIVKRSGLASYFWGDNSDRTVYQGSWTATDEVATLSWPDGTKHQITRDALGFGISYIGSDQQVRYTAPAQQVPKEVLGQWAKPPTKSSQIASAQDQAKGFFGIWQIGDKGDNHYIFVESDRSAASNIGGNRGTRGSWAKQGSELHIVWDSGQYSILRENERAFAFKMIDSGVVIENDETEFTTATRTIEDQVPSTWLSSYKAEREVHTGGIAFSSRKNARAFYRGAWLIRLSEKSYERIEIGRFGGITSSTDNKLEGSWRMDGQDIFMRWDNGLRRILSPVGDGFILYDFKPGRPLDGVPTRTLPAAPADASKLEQHLKGREDVARQMLVLAEAAGINPAAQDAGWGRTFARWAWPFASDQEATTDALLLQGYEETTNSDPWWWPFWSESLDQTTTSETVSPETPEPEVTLELEAPTGNEIDADETEENLQDESMPKPAEESKNATKKQGSSKDWVWPF